MIPSVSGRTWDEAASPASACLVRRFEDRWRASIGPDRPDPLDFLPDDPAERPGALLALLRADLALRRESGEPVAVEWYGGLHDGLGSEGLVALLYEDFCQREEAGESPEVADYAARFPGVAEALREILAIHDLVGTGTSTAIVSDVDRAPDFPEAGQTIGGFRLVEELGRGSFARVYLAEERLLDDRPVALKVARRGSREPQTLARLQHTHIVPVHSYRIDPATDLHLLCMPYLGRLTLASVLADPETPRARSGADLVAILGRLGEGPDFEGDRPAWRTLARLNYAQAIAWWGARLAEGLHHAHERGVLHRDVKPSNVLVTSDGLPMLLDFNLAQSRRPDHPAEPAQVVGGTLAYMAPEHIEALLGGGPDRVDRRSDLYALGMVLREALTSRSAPVSSREAIGLAGLRRVLEERQAGLARLREEKPEVPPALDAVISRCLAPDPSSRYAAAADLADDLQAVADDGPLRHAVEPQPSRGLRWAWRNRKRLALTIPIALVLAGLGAIANQAQILRVRAEERAERRLAEGKAAFLGGDEALAEDIYGTVVEMTRDWAGLRSIFDRAIVGRDVAHRRRIARREADLLPARANPLRYSLLGFGGDPRADSIALTGLLEPYGIFEDRAWTNRPLVADLDAPTRDRLLGEIEELLFILILAAGPEYESLAPAVCERAPTSDRTAAPWSALRARFLVGGSSPSEAPGDDPSADTSARACFEWGLLRRREGRADLAIRWFERATRLDPTRYWDQFELAVLDARDGNIDQALVHFSEAIAQRPEWPWARLERARIYWSRFGAWDRAREDLDWIVGAGESIPAEVRLELGLIRQGLGDFRAAESAFEAVIRSEPGGRSARIARLHQAQIDEDLGRLDGALKVLDAIVDGDDGPARAEARRARARLRLRIGQPEKARADLAAELGSATDPTTRAGAFALRALASLGLGRPDEALADATEAVRLEPTPTHRRLHDRAILATGLHLDRLRVDRPEEIVLWPAGGASLVADLRRAVERSGASGDRGEADGLSGRLLRAVLLAALGDRDAAEVEAGRAIAMAPMAVRPRLIRARTRRYAGDLGGASEDLKRGLALDPDAADLWELRGLLELQAGRPGEALDALDRAGSAGGTPTATVARARALARLDRVPEAIDSWNRALALDPDDPRAFLGRASAWIRLGQWDQSLADLEKAAHRSGVGDGPIRLRLAIAYAACLPERPNRLPRVLGLARDAWLAAWAPPRR